MLDVAFSNVQLEVTQDKAMSQSLSPTPSERKKVSSLKKT